MRVVGSTLDGFWSAIPSSPSAYTIEVGDALSFSYSSNHDVWIVPSIQAWRSCDFTAARQLAGSSHGGGATGGGSGGATDSSIPVASNLFEAVATAPGTLYIACSVNQGTHCLAGQRIRVDITRTACVHTDGRRLPDGSTVIHADGDRRDLPSPVPRV